MKKTCIALLPMIAFSLLFAGCRHSPENNSQSVKIYSFSGENDIISICNGILALDGTNEICYGGNLSIKTDTIFPIHSYSVTVYLNIDEKKVALLSNSVENQTKEAIHISENVGKIAGDILKDSDAENLTDNLWFELKTTNLRGKETSYSLHLKTTEITEGIPFVL